MGGGNAAVSKKEEAKATDGRGRRHCDAVRVEWTKGRSPSADPNAPSLHQPFVVPVPPDTTEGQISIQLQMASIRLQQETNKKYFLSNRTGIKIYGFLSTGFDLGCETDCFRVPSQTTTTTTTTNE